MNADTTDRLFHRLDRPPWREILGHRWSASKDWAQVLRDEAGEYSFLGRRGNPEGSGAYPPLADEAPAPHLNGKYSDAFRVDTTGARGHAGGRSPHGLRYGVGRPVGLLVGPRPRTRRPCEESARLAPGTDPSRPCPALLGGCPGRIRQRAGAPEIMRHLGLPQRLEEHGLSYRVFDVRLRENGEELPLGGRESDGVRYSWTASRRGEYEFCLQALHAGPVSLAALWSLRHPEEVRQVLEGGRPPGAAESAAFRLAGGADLPAGHLDRSGAQGALQPAA